MDKITLISRYVPGAIGRIAEMHATYYAANWGLDLYFEAKMATEVADFFRHYQPNRDGTWLAMADGRIVGSICINGADADGEGARLRWFLIEPAYHGLGLGHQLLQEAVAFCDQQQFKRVYLTTFAGLDAARHLYEAYGFTFCGQSDGQELTGKPSFVEQYFEYFPPAKTTS